MSTLGTPSEPALIAIVGAGPAGYYAAEKLLRQDDIDVRVDMYEKLPTPYGLVRAGVAPDHEKIKNVTRVFDKTAARPGFRYFGNVEYGVHVSLADLKKHYHQVYFSTGAAVDRKLGIPGEDLIRSHSATEFVAWYNGHPEYRHLQFDLSQKSVAIIGMGNVAIDVARILCKTASELASTDIADYALEALSKSKVRTIYMIGRRGPAQAAFTLPEIKEMGTLEDASCVVLEEEARLDTLSEQLLTETPDRMTSKKLEIINSYIGGTNENGSKECQVRFLLSPTELISDESGAVSGMKLVRNRLEASGSRLTARATDETIELPVGLVFRSVGYRGVALPDLPFNESWGVVRNDKGRAVEESGEVVPGCYVGGWIKRGPNGVIGTNKPDAFETVGHMLEDLVSGIHLRPSNPGLEAAMTMVSGKQPRWVSYSEWEKINERETQAGAASDRPRVKITSVEEMLTVAGK
ncbi:MAG: NADP oxidoreductase [Bacteroidetes bacterium]|nr:MAG: NADP oxidoreductase [Bacteroidota bacterium]